MKEIKIDSKYNKTHLSRFKKTIEFIDELNLNSGKILDLGPKNPLGALMEERGFEVTNTPINLDLDLSFDIVEDSSIDIVTAFEIVEHLVSPFPLLRAIKAKKLLISVPLKLWFANAYWNEDDIYDRHYHEFEERQLKMLLNKANWTIIKSKSWATKSNKIGIRPLLRRFTPRHIIMYCERDSQ